MKIRSGFILLLLIATGLLSCIHGPKRGRDLIEVSQSYVPYKTEAFLRIGYLLNTWEYEKEGLQLQRIVVRDDDTRASLLTIEKADLPTIFKGPLPTNAEIPIDALDRYYLSIQVPIPLTQATPSSLSHCFTFYDAAGKRELTVEGGRLQPRKDEAPRLIAAPVKGSYYIFANQSTMAYHYWYTAFTGGEIYTSEKFAFDLTRGNELWENTYSGDPRTNSSYHAYGNPLYAVASGKVLKVVDGRIENSGDAHDAPLLFNDAYYGNYLILDIGGGCYAGYMHCKPHSFLVSVGDTVTEGQQLASLGNSGNSDEPHLHFQLTDKPDAAFSHGLPFVFKSYTKLGEVVLAPVPGMVQLTPFDVTNANMENWTVARVP
jgi:hypothetical protein